MIDVIGIVKIKDIGKTYCVSRSPCRSLLDYSVPSVHCHIHHLSPPHQIFGHSKMNVIARQTTNSQRSGHIRHASRSVRQASLRPTIASIAASTANAHPTAPCPSERTSSNFNLTFTSSDIQIECHCTPGNTNGHRTSDRRETFTTIASSAHCHSLRPPSLPAPPHLQTVAATPTATALRPSSRTSQHLRITSARLTPSARSLLPLSPPVSPHLRHSHVIANNSSVCLYASLPCSCSASRSRSLAVTVSRSRLSRPPSRTHKNQTTCNQERFFEKRPLHSSKGIVKGIVP